MAQSYTTQLALVTGSMKISFATGSGYIQKIQAIGNANESSSLQSLTSGDSAGPVSNITSASAGGDASGIPIDVPNGSVIEGAFNELKVHNFGDNTFIVFYKGLPTIINNA